MGEVAVMKKLIEDSMKLGFFQLLPLFILIIVIYFFINLLVPFIIPTLELFHMNLIAGTTGGVLLLLIILLIVSFFVGMIVRTTLGKKLHKGIEKRFFDAIPGYKILADVFEPFIGDGHVIKGEVALARIYNSSALVTLYILETRDDICKALLVCGGNPGMILVMYVPRERLVRLDTVNFQDSFKTLIGFGAGSRDILERYYEVQSEKSH